MKTLVFVTSQFPYGTSESFIAAEFPFLAWSFDKIIVVAQNVKFEKTRNTSSNTAVYRYNPATSLPGFLFLPVLLFSNLKTISSMYNDEIVFRKNLTTKNRSNLLKKIIKAIQLRRYLRKILKEEGINVRVINARFVKPLDEKLLCDTAKSTKMILTVEENVLMGGVGSAVLELLEEKAVRDVIVKRLGIKDEFVEHASQSELRRMYGIDEEGIMEAARSMMGKGDCP